MDHKVWLWRKKSTEKTVVASEKVNPSLKGNEEEVQMLLADRAELETDLKNLNEKLFSVLSECNTKDALIQKHELMAQEAIAGWKKSEAEAVSLKQELTEALHKRVADEERLTHLDAALKECMQQLQFVREEQEQRIHDAVMKTSKEYEKAQMILEEKLADANKRLEKISVEYAHLSKVLLEKEKFIEDLDKQRTQTEADLSALMTRLKSTEKDCASLKYEVRVLEKELEIRNEEREFNRRTAEASHKQHLESVRKIAKLESECQRLRVLVRKRLPGPAALAKMKNEVEMLGRDSIEIRRKLNSSPTRLMADSGVNNYPDTPSRRINILTDQLYAMEEENKTLKEALNKKANELQFSRIMYARTASKLSEVESQLEEPSKGQMTMDLNRSSAMSHKLSVASLSDIGSDDKISSAESWASALISELEHCKNVKNKGSPTSKTVGASEMNLMDDFVEMEKIAVVSVDKPSGASHIAVHKGDALFGPLQSGSNGNPWQITGREIISLSDYQSNFSEPSLETKSKLISELPGWLQDILKVISEQNHIAQRNPDEILKEIRVALSYLDHASPGEFVDATQSSPGASIPSHVSDYLPSKPSDRILVMNSPSGVANVARSLAEKFNQHFESDLSTSIHKIIALIEGINLLPPNYDVKETLSKKDGSYFSDKNTETPSSYIVRVFQWKTSELRDVLQKFVGTCYDLLSRKADLNKFTQELTSALYWIMNHCFSLQDVSSMRDAIKKQFDWDESRSESEAEVGIMGQIPEADESHLPMDLYSSLPIVTASDGHAKCSQKEVLQSNVREENRKLQDELNDIEAAKKDMERRVKSAIDKGDSVMNQVQESDRTIADLQMELETLKKSKGSIEDQVEDHKLIHEDLETQLIVINEAHQKLSSLKAELVNEDSCCEKLESTHLELQFQVKSEMKKEIPNYELRQEEKQLRTEWGITAASEKLAECQETILNLGKQLKALANPKEATLFDKVISTPTDEAPTTTITTASTSTNLTSNSPKKKIISQRSSLLDQMIAEDNGDYEEPEASKTNDTINNPGSALISSGTIEPLTKILILNGNKNQDENTVVNSLAIVPSKKHGRNSLWKKLLWRKKKGNSHKPALPFNPQQSSFRGK